MVFARFAKARYVLVRLLAFFAVICSVDLRVIAEDKDKEPVVYQEEPLVGGGTGEGEEAGLSSECGACGKNHSPANLTDPPPPGWNDRVSSIVGDGKGGKKGLGDPGRGTR